MVNKSNRNTHNSSVIRRNVFIFIYINSITVFIFRIVFCGIGLVKRKVYISGRIINIGKPANTFNFYIFLTVLINTTSTSSKRIIIRNNKLSITRMDRSTIPHFIVTEKRENIFVGKCIHISKN